jgi:pyrimidine operon attenuation protein/uracil phosphoribosyltransferase
MMDKKNPIKSGVSISIPESEYKNKSVVLVDDVLKSGSTLIYGVHHFLKTPLKQLKTAVLVNRNHKRYPVKADFKGISLSTSLQEHVTVEFKVKNDAVYLGE